MRQKRHAPLALLAAGALVLSACGGSSDDTSDDTTATTSTSTTVAASTTNDAADDSELVAGDTDAKPEVVVPDEIPTELVVTVLVPGSGRAAQDGDTVLVDYVGVRTEDGTEFDNSYDRGNPFEVVLGRGGVIQGWDQGLVGAQQGARLQLDIPAELAYGDNPPGAPIQPGDALTFVIDVRAVVAVTGPEDAPQIDLEPSPGVDDIVIEELVEGDGPEAVEGSTVFVHLIAHRGDNLEVLDNTWLSGSPVRLPMIEGQLLDGFYQGLLDMRLGGRRVVTLPPALAFGEEGNPALGLPAGVDLILVLDLIAVV